MGVWDLVGVLEIGEDGGDGGSSGGKEKEVYGGRKGVS